MTYVEADHPMSRPDGIIGSSAEIRSVIEAVDLIAPSDLSVLLTGETGTGKDLVAAAIHLRSERSPCPFVRVNCAAIPAELMESELFGHERGAFSGAIARRAGRFELADSGTLFLDEIGELSLSAQAKLLRVLQGGVFERVGGGRSIETDVRTIAAILATLERHRWVIEGRRGAASALGLSPSTLRSRMRKLNVERPR